MKRIITLVLLFFCVGVFAVPVYQNFFTTNTTPVIQAYLNALATNAALARIGIDTTKQPANTILTNLSNGSQVNAINFTNVLYANVSGPLFTGVVTNKGALTTNLENFANGFLTNRTANP